jgi:hypothetical protein
MHLIPKYPDEVPLELAHFHELQNFLITHRHGVSEFSFASLYPFTKKRHYTVSSYTDAKGELGYLFRGDQIIDGNKERFAMFPKGYPGKELIHDIFSYVQEINGIGEEIVHQWKPFIETNHPRLLLQEDRDNADYIYLKKHLIDLPGPSLHKKLQHALKFADAYPNRVLVPSHLANTSDMVAVLDAWAEGKDVVEDYQATMLAIEHRETLGLKGDVLYVDDKPIAFALGEEDGPSRFVVHIEKAIGSYRGVYQYINRAFAAELPEKILEINREQDLGIPGLRQAKSTYKPIRLQMKYRIRSATSI